MNSLQESFVSFYRKNILLVSPYYRKINIKKWYQFLLVFYYTTSKESFISIRGDFIAEAEYIVLGFNTSSITSD